MAEQPQHDPQQGPAPAKRGPDGPIVRRAIGQERDRALGMLLSAKGADTAEAAARFRQFADQQGLSLDETWIYADRGQTLASALIVPSAGRTAMIFVSPALGRQQMAVVAELVDVACRHQDTDRIRLVQSLLDPGQRLESLALGEAGFIDLATLLYMQRPAADKSTPLDLGPEIRITHWDERHRQLFADAISASYEHTRDCPGLVGLRTMDDIIAGHQATGAFDAELWYALSSGNEPIGVMLLNPVPQRNAMELAYLGIGPKWRGNGLARRLLEHGISLARPRQLPTFTLAVDKDNAPALHLYKSLRFVESGRRQVKLMVLDQAPT